MSRSGQIIASAVLAAVGIGFALGALEIGVRSLHLIADRFWEYDEVLGTRLVAGREGWWTQEDHEFRIPVRINSLGLRDRERQVDKPMGARRVLLIGDSHVEALQVRLDESIGLQLEERLRAEGIADEVISAGVSGYGTASQLLWFRSHGRRFAPDLVVLAFYPGNDVKNNSPELEKALVPQYDADGALVRVVGESPRGGGGSGILGRSAAYRYVRKLILTRQPALASLLVRMRLMQPAAIRTAEAFEGVPIDYWVYAEPVPPQWERAWNHTERNLDALRIAVEAAGARLMLVVVTARDRLDPEAWQRLREAYPRLREGNWNLEAPSDRILRWCQSRGVACLNLHPIFALAVSAGAGPLHFAHDGHWTAEGHALAAQATAEFIRQEALLAN